MKKYMNDSFSFIKLLVILFLISINCKSWSQNLDKSYFEPYKNPDNITYGYVNVVFNSEFFGLNNYISETLNPHNYWAIFPGIEFYQRFQLNKENAIAFHYYLSLYERERLNSDNGKNEPFHKYMRNSIFRFDYIISNSITYSLGYESKHIYVLDNSSEVIPSLARTELYFPKVLSFGFGYNIEKITVLMLSVRASFNEGYYNYSKASLFGMRITAWEYPLNPEFKFKWFSFKVPTVEVTWDRVNVLGENFNESSINPLNIFTVRFKFGIGLTW